MSGLNDDVDESLPFVDPLDSNPDQTIAPSVVLMNKVGPTEPKDNDPKTVPADKLFGSPLVPNELPNLNAEFRVITESIVYSYDLLDYRNYIASSNGISQEDAIVVNKLNPGFLSQDTPIGFFTEKKSRTQFNQTLNSIDTSLEMNCEKIKTALIDATTKLVAALRPVVKSVNTKLINASARMMMMSGELALMATDNDKPSALVDLLSKLETAIPNSYRLSGLNPDVQTEAFPELMSYFKNGKNINNLENVINPKRLAVGHVFEITNNTVYTLQENEPFLVEDEQNCNRWVNAKFKDILFNGMDMYAVDYFTKLSQVASNMVEAISTTNATIDELNTKTNISSKDRLDVLMRLSSINQKYAMRTISLMSFTNDYFEMMDKLVSMVVSVSTPTMNPATK